MSQSADRWGAASVTIPDTVHCTTTSDSIDLQTLFSMYFDFDDVLFGQICEYMLVAFVTGYGLGMMLRIWRKGQ
ncbi:MAG TPA: hypothetical protein DGG95_03215 [Cytophagales bacterium]|nr:hypothetical protein [Cytophagales bacterium]